MVGSKPKDRDMGPSRHPVTQVHATKAQMMATLLYPRTYLYPSLQKRVDRQGRAKNLTQMAILILVIHLEEQRHMWFRTANRHPEMMHSLLCPRFQTTVRTILARTRTVTDLIDIRFAVRAEVQHRTDPFETAILWISSVYRTIFKSSTSALMAFSVGLIAFIISRALLSAPVLGPAPDLVKVAGLAKSFEPLIHYSQHGIQQISDLQDTGIAVWDLQESMRSSNMTSSPIIVDELDNLSKDFKDLANELTKFFAHVDLDIDG